MKRTDVLKKKFSIVQELSRAIAITDDIGAIADLLLDLAISFANAEKGSLMLLTDRHELVIFAAKGLDQHLARSYKTSVGEGIAGIVAQKGIPVLVENIEENDEFRLHRRDHYKTRSFISCPIVSRNRVLGVLNINDKADGSAFDADEFELVKTLANHAAIALENSFLLAQLKTKASALEEINRKLIETDILKTEFLTRISHELRTPLNSVKGAIYILQQGDGIGQNQQQEFQGIIAQEVDNLITIVENLLGYLRSEDESRIMKRTVIGIDDVFREIEESPTLKAVLARKGIQLNIDSGDDRIEVIGDRIKVVQLFSSLIDGMIRYLERGDSIAIAASQYDQVTISITLSRPIPEHVTPILCDSKYIFQTEHPEDQLRLYLAKNIAETHRWNLSARNENGTSRITVEIPESAKEAFDIYVDRSMDSFVEFISDLLDLDICSIMLRDRLTSELTVKSAVGLDEDIVRKTKIKFGDKIAGWVALEGKPLFIEDIERDPRFSKKSISQYTTKSLISFPIKMADRVIGVLNLNNKKTSEPFTEQDYSMASFLSERISDFVALMYSDNCREEEIRQFIGSFDTIFYSDEIYRGKKNLLPQFADKILNNLKPLITIKHKPSMCS